LGLPLPAVASPQEKLDLEAARTTKRATAVRITTPIVVDGVLDDARRGAPRRPERELIACACCVSG